MSELLEIVLNVAVLGIIAPITAFLIVLNKYKNEIWGRIVFDETNNKGNDKRLKNKQTRL